jgi:predicted  nucleic acid-binding Zn-ribbon protein
MMTATAGIFALALAACSDDDTEAQDQIREQAEAIDQSYEAEADLEEALAEGGPNEEATEEYADALREKGERTEDQLKEAAEELDDVPQ